MICVQRVPAVGGGPEAQEVAGGVGRDGVEPVRVASARPRCPCGPGWLLAAGSPPASRVQVVAAVGATGRCRSRRRRRPARSGDALVVPHRRVDRGWGRPGRSPRRSRRWCRWRRRAPAARSRRRRWCGRGRAARRGRTGCRWRRRRCGWRWPGRWRSGRSGRCRSGPTTATSRRRRSSGRRPLPGKVTLPPPGLRSPVPA